MSRPALPPAFRRLLAINFLVWFAGYQVFPVIPLHLRELGASLAGSGRFAAFLTLGTATGALLLGRLADRIGAARLLRAAAGGLALLFVGYGFLPAVWPFLLAAPLHGLLWAGMKTSAMSLAAQALPPEHRTTGLSWFGLSGALGVALGPLAGLALLPLAGFRLQIIGTAAAFAFIALGSGLRSETAHEAPAPDAPWPGRLILAPLLLIFAWGNPQGALPPFSAQEARFLGLGWTSALLTAFALGMLAARTAFGTLGRGISPRRMLPWLCLGGIAAMLGLALAPGALVRHLMGGAVFGASLGLAHTLLFAEAVDRAGARRGEAVGLMYLAYELGMGLGAALGGQCMELVAHRAGLGAGFRAGWALGALPLLIILPIALRRARRDTVSRGPR